MLRPRLIASLLVDQQLHLVKTNRFHERHYLGDPLNAAYVFSGFEVDELLILAIDATAHGHCVPLSFVESIARFTSVPLCVGGGLANLNHIHELLALGVEKVALSSALCSGLNFLEHASQQFGSSTITVVLNLCSNAAGEPLACFGRPSPSNPGQPLFTLARDCQLAGAGELVLYDSTRDGSRLGFDIPLFAALNDQLTIPLVALGGCGSHAHIQDLLRATSISGVAAGSLFAYAPWSQQVLFNYPLTSHWFTSLLASQRELYT